LATAQSVGAKFYPVHPRFDQVFGQKCFPSVNDIPGDIDVLIVQVSDPAKAIREAAAKRPKFAVVFTSGYSETGTADAIARELDLKRAAQEVGVRLLGPNTNINSLEVRRELPGPGIALVTQSGAQGRPIIQGEDLGVRFTHWATTGNEADLEAADFIEYCALDNDTKAISCYIEGFKSGQRIREAALAALERDVAIVLVKVGRTSVGEAMAVSHTAHLTGQDSVHDAFFEQYGITRVDDLDELLEVSTALARLRTPSTPGVVVYGMSGGTGAHLGDLVTHAGLDMPRLSESTQKLLRELIPDHLVVHNPVDNGGVTLYEGTGPDQMDIVMADPSLGVLIYAIPGAWPQTTRPMIDSLERARAVSDAPILAVWSGPTTDDPSYERLIQSGIPVVRNYRNAIKAAAALIDRLHAGDTREEFIRAARALSPITGPYGGRIEQLDEAASATWLAKRGVVMAEHVTADTVDDAVAAADKIGYPVVLKGRGEHLAHKSEHGLVDLGLHSAERVRRSAMQMLEVGPSVGMEGYLVARQVGAGVELLVGITQDPVLGPVVIVGSGGINAEALKDTSMSVLPLLRSRANEMLDRLRIAPLLSGWRGQPGVDREALIDLLLTLGDLAASGEVEELDINPVIALPKGYVGVDALVRRRL